MRQRLYMGSSTILIGAVALGTALIGLFFGYRWGRSNVRSQIENALDMARGSADAREFALREQLDQKMLELSTLRVRADEVQALRDELALLQLSSPHNSKNAGPLDHAVEATHNNPLVLETVVAAAEDSIQSFFQPHQRKSQPPAAVHDSPPEPSTVPIEPARPAVAKFPTSFSATFSAPPTAQEPATLQPVESAKPQPTEPAPLQPSAAAKPPQPAKPQPHAPAKSPAPTAVPTINNDDWDEFAKSLAALTNLKK